MRPQRNVSQIKVYLMKICPKCKSEKDRSEFYRKQSRKSGLGTWCKDCCQKYRQSDAGKEAQRRGQQKYRQLNPEKIKAHHDVEYAIKKGKLIRPDHCESCKKETFVESHHEDYSKPLDVEWLCIKCHTNLCRKE